MFLVHYRIKPEYILLSGLWSGTKKPPMDVLLKPLVMSMKSLSGNGMYYALFPIMCVFSN